MCTMFPVQDPVQSPYPDQYGVHGPRFQPQARVPGQLHHHHKLASVLNFYSVLARGVYFYFILGTPGSVCCFFFMRLRLIAI